MARCEFAPGSPWKTTFLGVVMARSGSRCCKVESTAPRDQLARTGEILERIDAERYAVNDGGVDAHAGFERAQLFELLAPLERRWRQRDEPFQRGASVRIEPDMVVVRPVAPGRLGAGEIERAQPFRSDWRADKLDHARVAALLRPADLGRKRCDVDGGIDERLERGADVGGRKCRQVTLDVDDDPAARRRIEALQCLENAVRP